MTLAEDARAKAFDEWMRYKADSASHIIDGVSLYMRHCEIQGRTPSGADTWEIDWADAFARIPEEAQAERFICVRYTMDYGDSTSGDIAQATETLGRQLINYEIAREVSEAEAVEYGRKRREARGGWMDSPKWRPFVASYKRIRTAVYSRNQSRLDTTTQASKAA